VGVLAFALACVFGGVALVGSGPQRSSTARRIEFVADPKRGEPQNSGPDAALGRVAVAEPIADAPAPEPPAPTREEPPAVEPPPSMALWAPVDGAPEPMPGTLNGHVGPMRRIRLDRSALSSVEVGTRITFEAQGGGVHVAIVERLIVHENGDRTWSGHLEPHGLRYPVVYTQGEPWTFATLATPDGLYALEANAEEGVLFKDEREALQADAGNCERLPD